MIAGPDRANGRGRRAGNYAVGAELLRGNRLNPLKIHNAPEYIAIVANVTKGLSRSKI